jgi:hypothetical protein
MDKGISLVIVLIIIVVIGIISVIGTLIYINQNTIDKSSPEEIELHELNLKDLETDERSKVRIGSVIVQKYNLESIEGERILGGEDEWGFRSCKVIFRIKDNIRVEMEGWCRGDNWDKDFPNHCDQISKFAVYDGKNELIERVDPSYLEFNLSEDSGKVEVFDCNNKTYFLIHGGVYGMRMGTSRHYLYVIDHTGAVSPVENSLGETLSWSCDKGKNGCSMRYAIGFKDNLYLYLDGRVLALGHDDILKEEIHADLLLVKGNNLYFKDRESFCFDFFYGDEYTAEEIAEEIEDPALAYQLYYYNQTYKPHSRGCVSEYYLAETDGGLKKSNNLFKEYYQTVAIEIDKAIKDENWTNPNIWGEGFYSACLHGKTEILTASGNYKKIEDICRGDEIVSFDLGANQKVFTKVIRWIRRRDPTVTINNKLRASTDHNIFIDDRFEEVKNVEIGDYMFGESGGNIVVDSISSSGQTTINSTYDIGLDKCRNFFADGILVQGLLPIEDNWLSLLMARSLNYIFAGMDDMAWNSFSEDYFRFLNKYPVRGLSESNFDEIKNQLKHDLNQVEE